MPDVTLIYGELTLKHRLGCRARVHGDARVVLTPIEVYTNKAFKSSDRILTLRGPILER